MYIQSNNASTLSSNGDANCIYGWRDNINHVDGRSQKHDLLSLETSDINILTVGFIIYHVNPIYTQIHNSE